MYVLNKYYIKKSIVLISLFIDVVLVYIKNYFVKSDFRKLPHVMQSVDKIKAGQWCSPVKSSTETPKFSAFIPVVSLSGSFYFPNKYS